MKETITATYFSILKWPSLLIIYMTGQTSSIALYQIIHILINLYYELF